MTLGAAIADQIPFLRSQAESLMVDTARVTRPGGEPTFDPATGLLTPSDGTVIFSGPCRLIPPSGIANTPVFGEQQVTESRYVACFRHDATDAKIGDIVTFTESDDPDVLDRSFRIAAVPASSFVVYKGYPCESVEV